MLATAGASEDECQERKIKEAELMSLKRTVHCMAVDRQYYTDESRVVLRRQKEEITKLKEDKETFTNLIGYMNSTLIKSRDRKSRKKLQDLALDIDSGKNCIKNETETLRQLNFQIMRKDDAKHLQMKLNGKKNKPPIAILLRRIRSLENRLEKENCKFNVQLTKNREMRDQIDHLRYGRSLYSKLFANLSSEVAAIKKDRKSLTKMATESYTCGNDAKMKFRAITERTAKEKEQHLTDLKGLQRIIEHHDTTAEFMELKSFDRSKQLAEVLNKKKKLAGDRNYCQEQTTIMKYEDAFNIIKDVANETNMEKIMKDFMDREDQNYAMFNYINELNESIDAAKLELDAKYAENERYSLQNGVEEEFRRNVMAELEQKEIMMTEQIDKYTKKYVELRKKLDELKGPVRSLFNSIGCDPSPMSGMLGYSDEVTDSNLMQYLGIIENRAMETLNTHFFTSEVAREKSEPDPAPKMLKLPDIPAPPVIDCVAPQIVEGDFLGQDKMNDQPLDKTKLLVMVRGKLDAIQKRKSRKTERTKKHPGMGGRTKSTYTSASERQKSLGGEESIHTKASDTSECNKNESTDDERSPEMKTVVAEVDEDAA